MPQCRQYDWFCHSTVRASDVGNVHLNLPFALFVDYPKERRTRWEHQERIREYLSFNSFDSTQQEKLSDFLLEQALQCDSGAVLVDLAYWKLRKERIVRPGASTIEWLVLVTSASVCFRASH